MSHDNFLVLKSQCGNPAYSEYDLDARDVLGVKEAMDRFGVDAVLDARDQYSFTCLTGAALSVDPSLLFFLLRRGADPNEIFLYGPGGSPIVTLNYVVNVAGAELLFAHGANAKLLHSITLQPAFYDK